MSKSVGIKELKDTASQIVSSVIKNRQPVTITKSRKNVARIVPFEDDAIARLTDSGLVAGVSRSGWDSLKLKKVGVDAARAIRSIRSERDQG